MDDAYKYPSVLSDIDISLDLGSDLIDPFKLLNVKSIQLDPQFNKIFTHIDFENLYNETSEFDPEEWYNVFSVILYQEELKDALLRFAWWVCREILFGPKNIHVINISDLLNKSENELYIKIFLYSSSEYYKIAIKLSTGAQMIIKFTNNEALN